MGNALLITGGAGFIGSCFTAQAVAKGWQVIVLDALTYAGSRKNLEWITPRDSWQLVEGTINDRALVLRLLREHSIHHVVNFAAATHVDHSIKAPAKFIETNVNGVFNLLEACREYWQEGNPDFRFVHISTDEVYGSLGPTGTFFETSPLHTSSPYSASKAAGDHLVQAWHTTYGFPGLITRCGNNYGPRQHCEKFIPTIILSALSGNPIPVYGDGKNIRDWIHVEDHCDGIWLALEKGKPGEVYNLGASTEVENVTLVNRLCAHLQSYNPQIVYVTDRPGHDRRYALNTDKARKELGFAPQCSLDVGLLATINWYKEHAQ